VKPGYDVRPEFTEIAKISFNAEVDQLNKDPTNAADIINRWVANSTENNIDNLIPPGKQ